MKKTKRKIIKIIIYVLFAIVVFFLVYGIKSFVLDIRHQMAHKTEATITTSELEEIVKEKEVHFLEQDSELIGKLKKEHYSKCTTEEQLEILAQIGYLEAEYLGITVPEFKVVYLRNDLAGYYNHEMNQIVLNVQHISHEKCVIRTVLHEMYHAYQYACIQAFDGESELLWARQIEEWRAETEQIENDFDSNEGLISYYTAASEETAREYAEKRTKLYFDYVETQREGAD